MQVLASCIFFSSYCYSVFVEASEHTSIIKQEREHLTTLQLLLSKERRQNQGITKNFNTADSDRFNKNAYKNSQRMSISNPGLDSGDRSNMYIEQLRANLTYKQAVLSNLDSLENLNISLKFIQHSRSNFHQGQQQNQTQQLSLTQLQLHQVFPQHNLSIGKQPVLWGTIDFADSLNFLNYQSGRGLENNWLGKLTWYGGKSNWQVVYIPFSKSNKQQILTQLNTQPKSEILIKSTKSSELGLRYALTLPQSDLAFYAGHLLQDDYYIFQQQLAVDRYFLFGSSANITMNSWLFRFDGAIKANLDVISKQQLINNHLLDYAISLEYLHHTGWNINTGLQQKIFLKDTQLQMNPTTKIPLHKRNVLWVIGLSKLWQSSELNINTHIISSQHSKLFILNTHVDYIFNKKVSIRSKLGQYFSDSDLENPKPRTDLSLMLRYDF